MSIENEIVYPSIVFKIKDGLYSINSKYVITIMQLIDYEAVPESSPAIMGIMPFRGGVISLIDLRTVFGMVSLKQEYEEFAGMLEMRKQDHIHWVKTLESSVNTGEPFTLATDPHQCAFGKWYDNYTSDKQSINFLLRKIDEPHRKLHEAAHEVQECSQECDHCQRAECLKIVLERVEKEYMTQVLHLLDEAKEEFMISYREMILVLKDDENREIGIVVDEVLGVEDLDVLDDERSFDQFASAQYVYGVKKSCKIPGLILELDGQKLLEMAESL